MALFSRFLLLFYLARHFPVATVGAYGLVVVITDIAVYMMGLEFASFGTRELIHRPLADWPGMLRDQGILHLFTLLAATVVLLSMARMGLLIGSAGWLVVLVAVEHVAMESYRMLIAASRPLLATLMYFIRFGGWVYPALVVMWAVPGADRLETVWAAWIIGSLASLAVPATVLPSLDWRGLRWRAIDWTWLRRGLRVAFVFFVSDLFTRATMSLDRFILQVVQGAAEVGVYHFFLAIANVLPFLIDAGVHIHHAPQLVKLHRAGADDGFRRGVRVYLIRACLQLRSTMAEIN
jgi:hypothetical protein